MEAGRMITRLMTSESSSTKAGHNGGYQPTLPIPSSPPWPSAEALSVAAVAETMIESCQWSEFWVVSYPRLISSKIKRIAFRLPYDDRMVIKSTTNKLPITLSQLDPLKFPA